MTDDMNVARAAELAVEGRTYTGSRSGMMQGGDGGGGECVDDEDVRDAKDDVMMVVIARNIIIITAWLSGTQWSQGEDVLLPSWIAPMMSDTLRRRTPTGCHECVASCMLHITCDALAAQMVVQSLHIDVGTRRGGSRGYEREGIGKVTEIRLMVFQWRVARCVSVAVHHLKSHH